MYEKSHINEAFSIVNKLLEYDADTYADVIFLYFRQNNWLWNYNNIDHFFTLWFWYGQDQNRKEPFQSKLYYKIDVDKEIILLTEDEKDENSDLLSINEMQTFIEEEVSKQFPGLSIHDISDPIVRIAKAKITIQKIIESEKLSNKYNDVHDQLDDLSAYFLAKVKGAWKKQDLRSFLLSVIKSSNSVEYIEGINGVLFFHLLNSILNAEYLVFNEYSKKISELIPNTDEKMGQFLFYTIKSFVKILWHIEEMCSIIRTSIEDLDRKKYIVRINSGKENRIQANPLFLNAQLFGEDATLEYEKLFVSIVRMTLIDHMYITNMYNIEVLSILDQQVDAFLHRTKLLPAINTRTLLTKSLNNVKAKTRFLLCGMVNPLDRNVNEFIYIIDGKISDLGDKMQIVEKVEKIKSINPVLCLKKEYKNQVLDYSMFNNLKEIYDGSRSDLRQYDRAIDAAIKAQCELSPFYKAIHETPTYDDFVNGLKIAKNYRRPSFYICSIMKLVDIAKEQIDSIGETFEYGQLDTLNNNIMFLRELLGNLYLFIKNYSASFIRIQYRPYFSKSFYYLEDSDDFLSIKYKDNVSKNIIDNYDKDAFNDSFFFASLGSTPLNFTYLERFRSEYDNVRRELSDKFSGLFRRYSNNHSEHVIGEKVSKLSTDVKTKLKDITKKVNQAIVVWKNEKEATVEGINEQQNKNHDDILDKLEKTKKEIRSEQDKWDNKIDNNLAKSDEKLGHLQQNIVTVLGVFASLIAFAAISIGMVGVVDNILEYILFVLAFSTGLSIFAVLVLPAKHNDVVNKANLTDARNIYSENGIADRGENRNVSTNEQSFWRRPQHVVCCLLIGITIVFGIIYFSMKSGEIQKDRAIGFNKEVSTDTTGIKISEKTVEQIREK